MTQPNPREIERRLADAPAPPPPDGLLEKIQEEIPEPSEVWGETTPSRPTDPSRWLIAASVVVAVGGGLLGYRTFLESDVENLATRQTADSETGERHNYRPLPREVTESLPPLGYLDTVAETAEPPTGNATEQRREAASAAKSAFVPPRFDRQLSTTDEVVLPDSTPDTDLVFGIPEATGQDRETTELAAPLPDLSRDPKPEWMAYELQESRAPRALPGQGAQPPIPTVEVADPPVAVRGQAAEPAPRPSPIRALGYLDSAASASGTPAPSTGGTAEPNDQPYGDVFYREYGVNPFVDTEDDRLSTFGLDVDTGSYSIVRRYLDDGNLPPREAIRIEELLNYFDYRDAAPQRGDFALHADLAPAPFGSGERYQLLRFGVRGREVSAENRQPATLIFVVDVSGSMARENRLGLVIRSLNLLLDQLREDDRVGLVIYGSRGQILLEPTGDLEAIRRAVRSLQSGGSTNAEEGLILAYDLASRHYRGEAINRIILCSDGVANVGATGPESILERVRREAERGIELTTIGFGMGNYNDVLMEQLANQGDGSYAYVDDLAEAQRIFVENLTGTLQTIASDAKVQVEFNVDAVSRYRLIGYENRDVADDRFRDDSVDAGEVGAGHSVVALYEIKLREDRPKRAPLATLHLRWRSEATGQIVETELTVHERDGAERFDRAPAALKLAAAVAEFGEILKDSYWAKDGDLGEALAVAQQASAGFAGDADVAELVGLIAKAAKLRADG